MAVRRPKWTTIAGTGPLIRHAVGSPLTDVDGVLASSKKPLDIAGYVRRGERH